MLLTTGGDISTDDVSWVNDDMCDVADIGDDMCDVADIGDVAWLL